MIQKIYKPTYKVHRLGNGLYTISTNSSQSYINTIRIGSRNFYHVSSNAPLFPTLRDAVMFTVSLMEV